MTGQTVLVVEDDPAARKMMRTALAVEGYQVLEAEDAEGALRLAAAEMPDLILQDLILPDTPGFALIQQLRALPRGATVPILAVSGMQSRLEDAWRTRGGYSAFLFKPVRPSALLDAIRAHLPAPDPGAPAVGQGRTVLVVHGSDGERARIGARLAGWGFAVDHAADAAAALARARQGGIDVVVTDVLMAGTNGYELCVAIRREPGLARLPVVLLSVAPPDPDDRRLAAEVGASALLMGLPDLWGLRAAVVGSLAGAPPVAPAPASVAAPVAVAPASPVDLAALGLDVLARLATLVGGARGARGLVEALARDGLAALPARTLVYLTEPGGGWSLAALTGLPAGAAGAAASFFGRGTLVAEVLAGAGPRAVDEPALLEALGAPAASLVPLGTGPAPLGVLVVAPLPGVDAAPAWPILIGALAGLLGHALVHAPATPHLVG